MKRALQGALLRLYAGAQETGLLRTGPGRRLFEGAYKLYKAWFEAGAIDHLQALVPPGSTVVDIGANIGFFTQRFARWTGPQGRVIALEPESENFRRLGAAVAIDGRSGTVEALQVVAGECAGNARLHLNPAHPGDHRLRIEDEEGVDVPMVRLDDLLAARGWPKVSLVKIDVQGAEERVLLGAERTLTQVRPAWFVEVGERHLRAMGGSAHGLLGRFTSHGYAVRRLGRKGIGTPLEPAQILAEMRRDHYEDLLFTP